MQEKKIVLKTLALADAFGWAMTATEVWRYALNEGGEMTDARWQFGLNETVQTLDALRSEEVLMERDGHYVLHGREHLIDERLMATHLMRGKRKKAQRWANRMAKLPYVLGVFAYGSLATGHVKEGSDLDVYVVLNNGRIFTGRVLTSLFLEMFGVRRTAYKVQDQVCLNHFAIRDAMSFEDDFRNPFSAWLWARMFPLAGDADVVAEFYRKNVWVNDYFPNLRREAGNWKLETGSGPEFREQSKRFSNFKFPFANTIERKLGEMQLRKIERNPLTQAGTGRIVANEREMIFHPGLPEEKVLADFADRKRELALQD